MAFNVFATATTSIPLANLDANFTLLGSAAAASTLYPTATTSITYGTTGTTHYLSGSGVAVTGTLSTTGETLIGGAQTLAYGLGVKYASATSTTTGDNKIIRLAANASGADVTLSFTDAVSYNTNISAKANHLLLQPVAGTVVGDFSSTGLAVTGALTTTSTINSLTVGLGAGSVAGNTVLGQSALTSNSTGGGITVVGFAAATDATAGDGSTYIGAVSGQHALGANNTAVGSYSLNNASGTGGTGTVNSAFGRQSLYSNTSGSSNSAFGAYSLYNNLTASNNTAVGYQAGYSNTTGSNNVALGSNALQYNTVSGQSVAIGRQSLQVSGQTYTAGSFIVNGSYTIITAGTTSFTAIGAANNTPGTSFVATGVGSGTGTASANADGCTVIGHQAGLSHVSNNITALGYYALRSNTVGDANIAIGNATMFSNSTGNFNIAIGNGSRYNGQGSGCTTIGYYAAYSIGDANYVTALGQQALYVGGGTPTGSTGIGYAALYQCSGAYNTGVGYNSGSAITSGAKNVILGSYTGSAAPISATGSNYVVLSDGDGNIVASTKTAQTFALPGGTLSSGTGIAFPATQSASTDANTLDDYEEGTWTPVDSSGASLSFTGVVGTYTKVGRLVTVLAELTYPTTTNTSSAIIGGLPFTSSASGGINGYIRYTTVSNTVLNFVTGGTSSTTVSLLRPGVNVTNVSMSAGTLLFAAMYYV